MSDLLKKYDRKWDNNSVKEHNASMLSLLETEIEKYNKCWSFQNSEKLKIIGKKKTVK